MVVHPRLIGVLLRGRSAWKAVEETDYFVLQHHPRQTPNGFRIITRGFPHYRVAEGDSVEMLQVELEYLSRMARVSIEGKITSKKISTWLKAAFERNSVLALSPPEDHLLPPEDSADHHHDADADGDGYLSDSSYISNEEMTDSYAINSRPLRRAISLEDLRSATAIHRQLRDSGLLATSRIGPVQNIHRSQKQPQQHHLQEPLLNNLPDRPESSASITFPISADYPHPRRHRVHSTTDRPRTTTPEHTSFVPLKSRPHSAMALNTDHDHEPFLLDQDHGDQASLPTPEVSPEELTDSSEELVIIQGDLLEEARSIRSVDRMSRSNQHRYHTFPGATTVGAGPGPGPMLAGEDPASLVSSWSWLTESPFLDALVSWIEGPDAIGQPKPQENQKPNPWVDMPLQFIALLTYPEPDPKTGNKTTLAMVRETAFVRQRRKTLLMLTAYTLVVRYCSFDFFLLVLFASNCAMLYFMKNSGRMNVNMAKRAVRQRVGWAKQWAGSIFKRGGNNNNTIASNGNNTPAVAGSSSQSIYHQTHSSASSQYRTTGSASQAESIRTMQPSAAAESSTTVVPESSPQMKRRGLFGKRMTLPAASSTSMPTGSASTTAASVHVGRGSDGASVMTTTTTPTKRRFFRRNNNNSTVSHATVPPPASAPVPIPTKPATLASSSPSAALLSTSPTSSRPPPALSSSPLTQSQSLPQLQFSPLQRPFSSPGPSSSPAHRGSSSATPPPAVTQTTSPPSSSSSLTSSPKAAGQQDRTYHHSSAKSIASLNGHQYHDNRVAPIIVSPPANVASPSPTTPLMFSGLSQLLSRTSPPANANNNSSTTTQKPTPSASAPPLSNTQGRDLKPSAAAAFRSSHHQHEPYLLSSESDVEQPRYSSSPEMLPISTAHHSSNSSVSVLGPPLLQDRGDGSEEVMDPVTSAAASGMDGIA